MADISDYTLIRPGQLNPDLTFKSGTAVARPKNITDDPMAAYKKTLGNALGPNVFEGVSRLRGIVLLSYGMPDGTTAGSTSTESSEKGFAYVMIPELHSDKPNPFSEPTRELYYKTVTNFYPLFPVILSSEQDPRTRTAIGNIVQVTFSDANKTIGRITSIESRETIDVSVESFSERNAKGISSNLNNGQTFTASQAIAKASQDLEIPNGQEFYEEQFNKMVPGSTFTSPYGPRTPPVLPDGSRGSANHAGIDLAAPLETDVNVLLQGTVVEVVERPDAERGFGTIVKVEHSDGTVTQYAHLSSVTAFEGQELYAGDPIGGVGSTGGSTGNHLDFTVYTEDGGTIDPLVWMRNNLYEDDLGDASYVSDDNRY